MSVHIFTMPSLSPLQRRHITMRKDRSEVLRNARVGCEDANLVGVTPDNRFYQRIVQ